MKKKILFAVSAITVISVGIYLSTTDNQNDVESLKDHGNKIAMYIEDDDGEYVVSTNSTFPTDGYVLNVEKSVCQNGGKPSQDSTTKAISLSTSVSESCTLYFEKEKIPLVDIILSKANNGEITTYEGGNKGELFTFNHEATTQTSAQTDYRYLGNTPNNYVTFNGETWRIIGVFETENSTGVMEQRIKIVRQEMLGNLAWDSTGSNEWSTASLKTLLNGDYYNRTGSYASIGLSEEARAMIEPAKWYLGGSSADSSTAQLAYSFERGTTVYSGRTTNIVQNVGLIYPSDYIYTYASGVNDKCYTDAVNCGSGAPTAGWMFNMFGGKAQWIAVPYSRYPDLVFYVHASGGVINFGSVTYSSGVRPVVYLKSSIKLVDGDGTQGNPYIIK